MIGYILGGSILLMVVIVAVFVNVSPQMGGKHSQEDKIRYQESGHYVDGKFMNLEETTMDFTFSSSIDLMKAYIKGNPKSKPDHDLPVLDTDSTEIAENSAERLIWFGHSAFLLHMDGKNILIDPMLGQHPSPSPLVGTKRFTEKLPIEVEELPEIDAVLISHDHYDHLDYGSIQALKDKTKDFYVPLGVGAHLRAWGIDSSRIHEHNWWDENSIDSIQIAFTPSRHFSGRGLNNNSSTLWGSWVIHGTNNRLFFSGDSGYGPHFKDIGKKYGPFDFAMLECGQYNQNWTQIHMAPEETAMAAVDIGTKGMMPIHWGSFKLALHDWNEPAVRVTKKANELEMPILIPKIGAPIPLDTLNYDQEIWWN